MSIQRESCLAFLSAMDAYRKSQADVVAGVSTGCDALTSALPQDDGAALFAPQVMNVVLKAHFVNDQKLVELAQGFVGYANQVFPNDPLGFSGGDPVGLQELPIPSPQNSRMLDTAAVAAWNALQTSLSASSSSLSEATETLLSGYLANKDNLEPNTRFMQDFDKDFAFFLSDLREFSQVLAGFSLTAGNTSKAISDFISGGTLSGDGNSTGNP